VQILLLYLLGYHFVLDQGIHLLQKIRTESTFSQPVLFSLFEIVLVNSELIFLRFQKDLQCDFQLTWSATSQPPYKREYDDRFA